MRLQLLSRRSEQPELAPEVGFGRVFPCIWLQLSRLHVSNQAYCAITPTDSLTAVCWQFCWQWKTIECGFEPCRVRGIFVLQKLTSAYRYQVVADDL